MIRFFDLHVHMLCGVDDGAGSQEEMFAMLESAYADGTRALCLTPHYSPYLFGDTLEQSAKSFAILRKYVAEKHPDMRIYLGHELGYHRSCVDALNEGRCRSMAGSRYVLVDFPESVDFFEIQSAMDLLQRSGYFPILAHTERYQELYSHFRWIKEFVEGGGIVQVNASSVGGAWGNKAKKQWIKLLKHGLVHIISSDGHNTTTRPPQMSSCLAYLQKHCSEKQVCDLVWGNAWRVIKDEPI